MSLRPLRPSRPLGSLRLPLQTARHAIVAAVVTLAVAAPATLALEHFLHRPPVEATAAVRRPAVAAIPAAAGALAAAAGKRQPRPAKRRPALPGPGLPGSVSVALKSSPVVVVALYAAGDAIDMAAGSEAEAGAALAKAPYVAVNVGDESQIGDIAARLPSLAVPSVVIFGHGGRVLTQIEGYADRKTVAEAVDSARPG